ncbi:map kinase phosphatase-like protein [Euroglyphus maynei]|uniref:Map kinase phosphatase-like protein n=1 Tax=Euroglyphus maynei TaxID=6958 RepID=A0A1Y3BN02_EURMA|nr:map kinase phosphatase-like protein [Euroglyphus maynei]
METLRVPISTKEPQTLKLYLNDVADKIHENYLKNGNTLIYCYDGSLNSVVLAIGYLIKYTDLWLSEAILHMKYTRKAFETTASGNELGTFRKPLFRFAEKHGKNDLLDQQ